MDQSLPWFIDALYVQWKRESDLVKSGGRISQPGRGEAPSLVTNEGPRCRGERRGELRRLEYESVRGHRRLRGGYAR
ncbi:MAG: hypothetical protein M5R42_04045 [Rhodocyclaceae bacterium]|nr:hypothetical protein [Rhodocyclaceae bacterium]